MDEKLKNLLQEPQAPYGEKRLLSEIPGRPVDNLEEYLRSRGCITLEEMMDRIAKYF